MKITAVIAEYNPFHNGHKHQLEYIKNSCDGIVVIMSGMFVQRGGVAIYDKWIRTKAALMNGADLVIELPVYYAMSTAQKFAFGSIATLDALGVADSLCFGSESGDIELLKNAAYILENEPNNVSKKMKELLDKGLSYPSAREKAFSHILPSKLLSQPNNILAIEYICELIRLNSKIKPITMPRKNVGHNDADASGSFASATAIRAMIENHESIDKYIPESTHSLYKSSPTYDISLLDSAILTKLRSMTPKELSCISDVSEGLENRIIHYAIKCGSFNELTEAVQTRRYPLSKIRRIILSSLLGIDQHLPSSAPEYIRVLGMNKTGMQILSSIKKSTVLPIITKTADFNSENFKLDTHSTDIAALCCTDPLKRAGGMDFITSPVIL